jgi:expansin
MNHSAQLLLLSALVIGCGGGDSGPPDAPSDGGAPGAPSDGGAPGECIAFEEQRGEGTFYDATGAGACSFDAQPGGELLVAAMNAPQFAGSGVCGMCARVVGPAGEVTVRIVDVCPECASGDLDLSRDAFARIAELAQGRVPIRWREVPCEVSGPIAWRFKEGSNPFWTAVQVREHRHRIARVAARTSSGDWVDLPRESYNFFVAAGGLGEGPYALRATDAHGNVVEDSGITIREEIDQPGSAQFPRCE